MHLSDKQHKSLINRMIRVNHAGEYAAKLIYQGQLSVLKGDDARVVSEMLKAELEHLQYFEEEIRSRNVRPTLLLPLINVLAYGLGVIMAKLGKESAMACTIAVEEVISDHYEEQLEQLGEEEKELSNNIKKFKQDEVHHLDVAVQNDGTKAIGYNVISGVIKKGCCIAIKLVTFL